MQSLLLPSLKQLFPLSIDRFEPLFKIVGHSKFLLFFVAAMVAISLLGCRAQPAVIPAETVGAASATPPAIHFDDVENAVPALIVAERAASIDGNLAVLEQLWTEDAQIIDGRTTDTAEDDYVWAGREAILDRYVVAVFPVPPPAMETPLQVEILVDDLASGDEATVINGVDEWRFVRKDGRWWITELAYQRP